MERTYLESETEDIAKELLALMTPSVTGATVLALQGDLGAGKTTLTKSLAALLGVQDTVVSPTFVIAKFYPTVSDWFEGVVHIDAYRIEQLDELGPLGWDRILQQPKTLVVIEWPEKISGSLPDDRHHFVISHAGDQRTIKKL